MSPVSRQKDRRQVNVPVKEERRRQGGRERRRCPACGTFLEQAIRTLKGGTVTASTCPSCGWTKSSHQTDADVLLLKLTWPLVLENHDGVLAALLPPELAAALKAKPGDEWVLSPLTSPLGSLPMQWTVSVKKARY
ncbi:MAG TPA: hypothetical protein VK914_05500 [bacterium]|jgi:hypothetical protein|nr:hypothetical protein [bacterium]